MLQMKRLRLALLVGGRSSEREVSLKGGAEVEEALDKAKYEITTYDPASDIGRLVEDAARIDVAFVLLHGRYGEDGAIQGMLDLLGIPYQGSGVLGSALAMDKEVSRIFYTQAGLNIPRGETVTNDGPCDIEGMIARIGLPLVIKPVDQGSSVGMSIPQTVEEVATGLTEAFKHSPRVLIEEYIKGTEITGGVIGNCHPAALPIVEIVPGQGHVFFDYQAKYQPGITKEVCPALIDPALAELAQQYAVAAHKALHLKGYSRTDMIIRDDRIFVLETNTIPGMTKTSLLPLAAREAGMEFSTLLDRLIALALEAAGRPWPFEVAW